MTDQLASNWAESASVAMVVLAFAAAVRAWIWFFARHQQDTTPLEYSERRPVPWGMIDVAIVVVIAIVVQMTGFGIWRQLGGDPESADAASASMMATFSIASLISWALALSAVCLRSGASLNDLGSEKPTELDLRQGVIAFCLLLLPVFGVQLILANLWQESQHPLIDMLKEEPDPLTFLACAFAAVIVAPLVEEFFFRVVVQGWLENLASAFRVQKDGTTISQRVANELFLGKNQFSAITAQETSAPETPGMTQHDSVADDAGPYESPEPTVEDGSSVLTAKSDLQMRPARWPVFVSAALFAMAHFSNGPDPIPLFILALGLGYLYRQTHRVWPCIVVHMLLNGMSIAQLWLFTQTLPS